MDPWDPTVCPTVQKLKILLYLTQFTGIWKPEGHDYNEKLTSDPHGHWSVRLIQYKIRRFWPHPT